MAPVAKIQNLKVQIKNEMKKFQRDGQHGPTLTVSV